MSRIPRKISSFDSYVRSSDNYLSLIYAGPPPVANWARLGLTQANYDNWHNFRLDWDGLYTQYTSPSVRTKAVTANVHTAMETFIAMAQPLLIIMAGNPNATDDDEVALNFKIGRSTPSHPTMPIAEQCFVTLENVGGAMVKFKCKTATDAKRAALPSDADGIVIAYKVGDVPPANASDGTQTEFLTRASDIKNLGIGNRGEQVHFFARWYNSRYPEFAGPWSLVTSLYLE